ncbi:8733_t:CDS:2 [Funneliformis geosporum]|uniref:4635_t:CDS:1 n=1 Tax=Funneliformis geosporum TaxID=1117311 RepID=A0A9W4SSK4_9GLOM|nr:8733_t:CDS:2 [Funneliformis geosporum]CAI2177643.1 4635_t:CDS:2 [Funneliformis geosporum]
MTTEYQQIQNESNSNHSIISQRRFTNLQEHRTPIPWYLDGCKLSKIVIFIVILSWTILVIWQVLQLGSSKSISYESANMKID